MRKRKKWIQLGGMHRQRPLDPPMLFKQNSEKNDGYAQRKQYWGVQIHHVEKHLGINLKFYIIL